MTYPPRDLRQYVAADQKPHDHQRLDQKTHDGIHFLEYLPEYNTPALSIVVGNPIVAIYSQSPVYHNGEFTGQALGESQHGFPSRSMREAHGLTFTH